MPKLPLILLVVLSAFAAACTGSSPVADPASACVCSPGMIKTADCKCLCPYPTGRICVAANRAYVCEGDHIKSVLCPPGKGICSEGECTGCGIPGDATCTDLSHAAYCDGLVSQWIGKTCKAGTVCHKGSCILNGCDPAWPKLCSGSQVLSCDPITQKTTGVVEDCAASAAVCVAGKCVPTCEKGLLYCDGENVVECSDGLYSTVYAPCKQHGWTCGQGRCVEPQCGQPCVAEQVCNAALSVPACVTPTCTLPEPASRAVDVVVDIDLAEAWQQGGCAKSVLVSSMIGSGYWGGPIVHPKSALVAGAWNLVQYENAGGLDWFRVERATDDVGCTPKTAGPACAYVARADAWQLDAPAGQCPVRTVLGPVPRDITLPFHWAFQAEAILGVWGATSPKPGVICGAVRKADLLTQDMLGDLDADLAGQVLDLFGDGWSSLALDTDTDGDGQLDAWSATFVYKTVPGTLYGPTP